MISTMENFSLQKIFLVDQTINENKKKGSVRIEKYFIKKSNFFVLNKKNKYVENLIYN